MARRAATADPACGECQAILGFIYFSRFWNWKEAERALAFAAAHPKASAVSHVWYAQLLGVTRRFALAQREIDLAIQQEPSSRQAHTMKGVLLYLEGRFAEALAELDIAQGLSQTSSDPSYWTYRIHMVQANPQDGVIARSNHAAIHASRARETREQERAAAIRLLRERGFSGVLRAWLTETEVPEAKREQQYERTAWQLWLGNRAAALDELEQAEKSRPFNMIYVAADPVFRDLWAEPGFQALLKRLGLPASQDVSVGGPPRNGRSSN
jgi:tetratricopeptide (TPR) repeat protein